MKVRALKDFDIDSPTKKGSELDLTEERANYFIRVGLVEEVKATKKESSKTDKK